MLYDDGNWLGFGHVGDVLSPLLTPENVAGCIYLDPPYTLNPVYGLEGADEAQNKAFSALSKMASEETVRAEKALQKCTGLLDFLEMEKVLRPNSEWAFLINVAYIIWKSHRALRPGHALIFHADDKFGTTIHTLCRYIFNTPAEPIYWRRTSKERPNTQWQGRCVDTLTVIWKGGAKPYWESHQIPLKCRRQTYTDAIGEYTRSDLIGGHPAYTYEWTGYKCIRGITRKTMQEYEDQGLLDYTDSKAKDGGIYRRPWKKVYVGDGGILKNASHFWDNLFLTPKEKVKGKWANSTQKPEALVEALIKATTKEGDLVIDPFGGTGTTAVAAMRTNRRFWVSDVNIHFPEFALERLTKAFPESPALDKIELTGSPRTYAGAHKLSTNPAFNSKVLKGLKGHKKLEQVWVALLEAEGSDSLGADGGKDGRLYREDGTLLAWVDITAQTGSLQNKIGKARAKLEDGLIRGVRSRPPYFVTYSLYPMNDSDARYLKETNDALPVSPNPRCPRIQVLSWDDYERGKKPLLPLYRPREEYVPLPDPIYILRKKDNDRVWDQQTFQDLWGDDEGSSEPTPE